MANDPPDNLIAGPIARLVVEDEQGAGRGYALGAVTRIGRDEECEVVIPNASVSRVHAVITQGWRGYRVHDQGSANGVFVNGSRVARARLRDGDELHLGDSRLRVMLGVSSRAPWRRFGPECALIALIAIIGGTIMASTASSPGPGRHKVEEAPDLGYRLMLPAHWGRLQHRETAAPFPGAIHSVTVYGGRYPSGQAVFAVDIVMGLPVTIRLPEAVALSERIGQFLYHDGTITRDGPVTVAGIEGREVVTEFEGPRGRMTTRVVYLVRGNDRYALIAASPTAWYAAVRPDFDAVMKSVTWIASDRAGQTARDVREAREWLRLAERFSHERLVNAANLHESVAWHQRAAERFRQAGPALAEAVTAREGLREAEAALETRFHELAFEAERALRLGDQETARRAVQFLFALVPDPDDERHGTVRELYARSHESSASGGR